MFLTGALASALRVSVPLSRLTLRSQACLSSSSASRRLFRQSRLASLWHSAHHGLRPSLQRGLERNSEHSFSFPHLRQLSDTPGFSSQESGLVSPTVGHQKKNPREKPAGAELKRLKEVAERAGFELRGAKVTAATSGESKAGWSEKVGDWTSYVPLDSEPNQRAREPWLPRPCADSETAKQGRVQRRTGWSTRRV